MKENKEGAKVAMAESSTSSSGTREARRTGGARACLGMERGDHGESIGGGGSWRDGWRRRRGSEVVSGSRLCDGIIRGVKEAGLEHKGS